MVVWSRICLLWNLSYTMIEIILSIVVITIALSAMTIGLLVNKPLKGSCGNCECEDKCDIWKFINQQQMNGLWL